MTHFLFQERGTSIIPDGILINVLPGPKNIGESPKARISIYPFLLIYSVFCDSQLEFECVGRGTFRRSPSGFKTTPGKGKRIRTILDFPINRSTG